MAKLSKDFSAGVLHPRENLFGTAVLGSVNAEVIVASDGCSSFALDMRGTAVETVEVSGSVDGANWTPIPVRQLNVASLNYVAAITYTVGGVWVGACAGFRLIRARATAWTSGNPTAVLSASTAALDPSLVGAVTTSLVTVAPAVGLIATLSLPTPGAGLRHYLTYLSMVKYASAALTASATPLTVTTTNLPGTLAFLFAADAALQGTVDRWREDFAYPLAASAQNTATTVVGPATTGVMWRITAGYYVAP